MIISNVIAYRLASWLASFVCPIWTTASHIATAAKHAPTVSLHVPPSALNRPPSSAVLAIVQMIAIQKNVFTNVELNVVVVAIMPTPKKATRQITPKVRRKRQTQSISRSRTRIPVLSSSFSARHWRSRAVFRRLKASCHRCALGGTECTMDFDVLPELLAKSVQSPVLTPESIVKLYTARPLCSA